MLILDPFTYRICVHVHTYHVCADVYVKNYNCTENAYDVMQ